MKLFMTQIKEKIFLLNINFMKNLNCSICSLVNPKLHDTINLIIFLKFSFNLINSIQYLCKYETNTNEYSNLCLKY